MGRRYMRDKFVAGVVAPVALSALLAACGSAAGSNKSSSPKATITLQLASYIGPSAPQMQALRYWADQLKAKSGGSIDAKFYYSGSLIGATDMLTGVSSGRADVGYMADAYFPAQLPMTSVVEIPFNNTNAGAQAQALKDLYVTSPQFRSEYEAQNLHVLFFPAIGGNVIGAKSQIRSLDDLRGLRVRSLGLIGKALNAVGADPVSIPADQLYQSLSTGVVKGYSGYAFEVISAQKLQEVAPYVVDTGMGEYVASIIAMNKSRYDGLPMATKKIIDQVSADAQSKSIEYLVAAEKQVCDDIVKSGGHVSTLSASDIAKWKGLVRNSLTAEWVSSHAMVSGGAAAFLQDYSRRVGEAAKQSRYVSGAQVCASKHAGTS